MTAATSFSRVSRWASIEMRPRLGGNRSVDADVVDALELLGDLSLKDCAGTLSRALDRVSGVSIHALLDENLLACRDELPDSLAQTLERLLQLLLCLDSAGEVAGDVERFDSVAVEDSQHLLPGLRE